MLFSFGIIFGWILLDRLMRLCYQQVDDGLSIGDKSVQLSQTSILPFSPQPSEEQVPVFSSVSIANGKAILNVTNTLPSLQYGISWVTSVAEVFSKTNWVSDVKNGEKDAQTALNAVAEFMDNM